MTTTKDIARELGISHSTVSRVLNAKQGVPVAEKTRQRVLAAARELDYRPNALARSLKNGRTGVVGFYSGLSTFDPRVRFFAEIQSGLQAAGAELGLDLLLHCEHHGARGQEHNAERLLLQLHDGRVDGFLVFNTNRDPLLQQLRDSHLPVVSIAEELSGVPSALADDQGGIRLIVEHLLSRGHRKFLFLAPREPFTSALHRSQSFQSHVAQAGVAGEVWTIPASHVNEAFDRWRALPTAERPTAICCWNDEAAYNWLQVAGQHGLRAPDDYALTGFDGFQYLFSGSVQRICSINCNWHGVGRLAMHLLHRTIEGEQPPSTVATSAQLLLGDTA